MLQGCLCQQFLSSHSWTLEFSAYRMFFFDLWSVSCNIFCFFFLVTPWLVVAVQPCIGWIPIKKKKKKKKSLIGTRRTWYNKIMDIFLCWINFAFTPSKQTGILQKAHVVNGECSFFSQLNLISFFSFIFTCLLTV